MSTIPPSALILSIDFESVGLYGLAYAAGYVLSNQEGRIVEKGYLSCPPKTAFSSEDIEDDRMWVQKIVPHLPKVPPNCKDPAELREKVYQIWRSIYDRYKNENIDVLVIGDCFYPVEANFFIQVIKDDLLERKYKGPFPFHELATAMALTNMKAEDYPRLSSELPEHNPENDALYCARLFITALQKTALLRI